MKLHFLPLLAVLATVLGVATNPAFPRKEPLDGKSPQPQTCLDRDGLLTQSGCAYDCAARLARDDHDGWASLCSGSTTQTVCSSLPLSLSPVMFSSSPLLTLLSPLFSFEVKDLSLTTVVPDLPSMLVHYLPQRLRSCSRLIPHRLLGSWCHPAHCLSCRLSASQLGSTSVRSYGSRPCS